MPPRPAFLIVIVIVILIFPPDYDYDYDCDYDCDWDYDWDYDEEFGERADFHSIPGLTVHKPDTPGGKRDTGIDPARLKPARARFDVSNVR